MKVIYLKRRGGKTTKAIAECLKTGAILVVINRRIADSYRTSHPELEVISHNEFIQGYAPRGLMSSFIIDDADHLLTGLAQGRRVRAITASRPFTKADCKKYGLPIEYVGRS